MTDTEALAEEIALAFCTATSCSCDEDDRACSAMMPRIEAMLRTRADAAEARIKALEAECFSLAATACRTPSSGENGDMECLALRAAEARIKALERHIQMHAGDTISLSGDADREHETRVEAEARADAAEARITELEAAVDRAPEPLRRLGEYLTRVLDEDQWATAERLLLGAADAAEARIKALETENIGLRAAIEHPLTTDEVIEVGRGILAHIGSEQTMAIGAISYDAAVTVRNIIRDRAVLSPAPEEGKK